jgi:hypothetical protein
MPIIYPKPTIEDQIDWMGGLIYELENPGSTCVLKNSHWSSVHKKANNAINFKFNSGGEFRFLLAGSRLIIPFSDLLWVRKVINECRLHTDESPILKGLLQSATFLPIAVPPGFEITASQNGTIHVAVARPVWGFKPVSFLSTSLYSDIKDQGIKHAKARIQKLQ